MKVFVTAVGLVIAAASTNAIALSLQDLLDRQEVVEISPVLVNGVQIEVTGDFKSKSANVCRVLGYTRVVSQDFDFLSGVIPQPLHRLR